MDKLNLVSEIPPSVNHYLGYRSVNRNGKHIAMSYKTSFASEYRKNFADYVTKEVYTQGWNLKPNKLQHFYVDAYFYFNRVDMDCNNYFKVMLDAITDTQLIWLDDNVVCERVQRILYDSCNPHIELVIYPVDYIGVFDNALQLETFKSNCFECTRNIDKCTILRKAIEGRLQNEINGCTCLSFKKKKYA